MPTKPSAQVYQLKITLQGIEPPIWRRVQLPSSLRLCCVHSAIQVVMVWTDRHIHRFKKGRKTWGPGVIDLDLLDECETAVAEVLRIEGDSLIYDYDLRNNWQHQVVFEKILPAADTS